MARFAGLNTQVLGISVDHVHCLRAWADSLGGVHYPLLSDFWPHGEISRRYGVMREKDGHSERAIFLIDAQGIIRYIDIHDIGNQPSNDVLVAELLRMDPSLKAGAAPATDTDEPLPHGGIVLYCTPWCGDCRRAKAWLEERGLAYTEVDISRNARARAQVRAWANGNETTPTFDIDGTIVVDYHLDQLAAALKV